jgi:hypothetical protein
MEPVLHPEPWGFAVWTGLALPEGGFALIREAEGVTLIAPAEVLARLAPDPGPPMARISLTIHSALEAVGLTAVISTALAAEGHVRSDAIRNHALVAGMPPASFHRALRGLLDRGLVGLTPERRAGVYVLTRQVTT